MWPRPGFVRFLDMMTSARAKEDDISLHITEQRQQSIALNGFPKFGCGGVELSYLTHGILTLAFKAVEHGNGAWA